MVVVREEPETELVGQRQLGLGVLVLAVVTGVLAGFAAAVLTLGSSPWGSEGTPEDASAEAGFARDMIEHHNQAVVMGLIAYRNATTDQVQVLGLDIATNQQGQIGMMYQWLRDWGLSPNRSGPPMAWLPDGESMAGSPMPGMATPEQLESLRAAEGIDVDRMFLDLMILHHLGGLHMVDGVLELSDDSNVTWLAGVMRQGQRSELQAMQDLLAELG